MFSGKKHFVMSLVGTLLLTVFAAQSVRADIIKDNLGSFSGVMPFDRIPGIYDITKESAGITIPGNNQYVGLFSFVVSFDYGDSRPNNPPAAGEFTIRLGFHSSTAAYANDPLSWNPEQPGYFHEVGTSAIINSGWTTPIGSAIYPHGAGERNLHLITLDLSSFNWLTTAGSTHVLSLSLDGTGIDPEGIVPYLAPSLLSNGPEDWWYSDHPFFGGQALPLTQFPMWDWGTNAAVQVQTHVPEPGSLCLLGAALLCKGRRRRDDCRCVKQAPALSTKATHIGPP